LIRKVYTRTFITDGIAFLIDDKVLFDTGEKGQWLMNNMKNLNFDIDGFTQIAKNIYTTIGEKSIHAELGEKEVVQNSKDVFPGLYVAGMAANAIFGGMLLSGERVAKSIIKNLAGHKR
jgi:ribulose 1,5-bisphosphate synthetase/thiazole synthase